MWAPAHMALTTVEGGKLGEKLATYLKAGWPEPKSSKRGHAVLAANYPGGVYVTSAGSYNTRKFELGDRAADATDTEEVVMQRLVEASPLATMSFIDYLEEFSADRADTGDREAFLPA